MIFSEKNNNNTTMKRTVAGICFASLFATAPAILTPLLDSFSSFHERVQPPEYWYKYESVSLATEGVSKGEVPKFVSDTTYYRNINMRWEDTLWCRQPEGIKKYTTQSWPEEGSELNEPGRNLDTTEDGAVPFWEYTASKIDPDATSCFLEWIAIGITQHGHQKVTSGKTAWFQVNI